MYPLFSIALKSITSDVSIKPTLPSSTPRFLFNVTVKKLYFSNSFLLSHS